MMTQKEQAALQNQINRAFQQDRDRLDALEDLVAELHNKILALETKKPAAKKAVSKENA